MKKSILTFVFFFMILPDASGEYCLNANKGFKDSSMIKNYLSDLAANSSGFGVAGTIGGAGGPAGKEIPAVLITENASWENDRGKPTVIITGAIHGNEWATPEVTLGIAEYLLENKDNDAPARDDKGALIVQGALKDATRADKGTIHPAITNVRELLQTIQVLIIPVFNPDGYDYSYTAEGRKSYYGTGWRANRRPHDFSPDAEICYQENGARFASPPSDAEHCYLADYDDTAPGWDIEEESVMVCESIDKQRLSLFESSLNVASEAMFDAVYDSIDPKRVVCASNRRRVWKSGWTSSDENSIDMARAKAEGYLQDAYGTDLNRNYKYKWDVTENQKHLFIRSRSPSSRMYRGPRMISEPETGAMEKIIARRNVVALIDYHAGSTQVLYPYAYSTEKRVEGNFLSGGHGQNDHEIFQMISEKIAAILNRHDRGNPSITGYTAAQNYNDTSVGSGVARDCYYQTEKIAAINIEVHDKRYTYENEEFRQIVPEICRTNVPGTIWFLFWAAGIKTDS